MNLRKEKIEEIKENFKMRLMLVGPDENIALYVYEAIPSSLDLSEVDIHEDYKQFLLDLFQPDI